MTEFAARRLAPAFWAARTDDARAAARADLLVACGEAIEGVGRLMVVMERIRDAHGLRPIPFYHYAMVELVEIARRVLFQVEVVLKEAWHDGSGCRVP